jgi:hypothetical protein
MTTHRPYALWQSGLLSVEKYRAWIRSMLVRRQINPFDAIDALCIDGGMSQRQAAQFLLRAFR